MDLVDSLGTLTSGKHCPGAESNHRHEDFQSSALPTELPGHIQNFQAIATSLGAIVWVSVAST